MPDVTFSHENTTYFGLIALQDFLRRSLQVVHVGKHRQQGSFINKGTIVMSLSLL